uniref:Chondrolectin n=1 Tax=Hippocampus comes TaxID=109280 RepID=A0A3Q2XRH6_HIPCM
MQGVFGHFDSRPQLGCQLIYIWVNASCAAILPAGAALTLGEADASHINGQRLCLGGARPACYKMAYFHHVSSRVDFWEAELACRVDGGHLVSIRTPQEQKHIQTLLEVAAAAALLTSFAISDLTFGRRSPTSSSSPSSSRSALSPTSSSPSVSRSSPSSHHHRRHRLRHRPHPSRRADDDDDERHPSDGVAPCPQRYRWTDGSAAAFREWHSDEPSCGAESCVVMYHQPGVGGAYLYQWNDDRCSMKHNFICKYQPERHPEEERGTTAAGRGAETTPDGNHVTLTGTSGTPAHTLVAAQRLGPMRFQY